MSMSAFLSRHFTSMYYVCEDFLVISVWLIRYCSTYCVYWYGYWYTSGYKTVMEYRFQYFTALLFQIMSRSTSVSKVSGYGLDDRAMEVRSPAGAEDFSYSLCVQTDCEAHPASCPMGIRGPFPGGKARPGSDADHSPPSSAEVMND
jgi:hypothetical protein